MPFRKEDFKKHNIKNCLFNLYECIPIISKKIFSLIEFKDIYGNKKHGIILNMANIIIDDSVDDSHNAVDKLNKLESNFKSNARPIGFNCFGFFKLNNDEYICNFPFKIKIFTSNVDYLRTIDYNIPDLTMDLKSLISTLIETTTKEERIDIFNSVNTIFDQKNITVHVIRRFLNYQQLIDFLIEQKSKAKNSNLKKISD